MPISKLSRGYAGRVIDHMHETESVIYIMRNNEPTAILMTFEDYSIYLETIRSAEQINKKERSISLSGRLHQYADSSKITGEREYYWKGISNKYE